MLTPLLAVVHAAGARGGATLPARSVALPLVAAGFVIADLSVAGALWSRRAAATRPAGATRPPAAPRPAAAPAARTSVEPAPAAPSPSSKRVRVPVADGLRGLAAVLVMAYHVMYFTGFPRIGAEWTRDFLASGFLSADFFFVLSGFVLFLPVATTGKFPKVKSYALRRAARILPAYYVALAATILVLPLVGHVPAKLPFVSGQGTASLLLHMTFLQHSLGVAFGYPEGFGVNAVMWTLSAEMIFYLLLPVIAVVYFRRPFIGLATAIGLSTAWKLGVLHGVISVRAPGIQYEVVSRVILGSAFPTYLANFAAGMTAAWIFVKLKDRKVPAKAWIVLVEALALIAVIWQMELAGHGDAYHTPAALDHWSMTLVPMLAFTVLLLAAALAPPWGQFPFTNWVSRRLGEISYGMYLWHLLFLGFALETLHFSRTSTWHSFATLGIFVLCGGVLAGTLSYVFLERPIIRWSRRWSSFAPQGPPKPGGAPAEVASKTPRGSHLPHPEPALSTSSPTPAAPRRIPTPPTAPRRSRSGSTAASRRQGAPAAGRLPVRHASDGLALRGGQKKN